HDVERMVLAARHRHDLGVAIHEHAGKVLALVENGRVGRAHERHSHLAHDRGERLPDDLERDRVDHGPRSRTRLPAASTLTRHPRTTPVVAPNSSMMAGPAIRATSGNRSRSYTGVGTARPPSHTSRVVNSASFTALPSPLHRDASGLSTTP